MSIRTYNNSKNKTDDIDIEETKYVHLNLLPFSLMGLYILIYSDFGACWSSWNFLRP